MVKRKPTTCLFARFMAKYSTRIILVLIILVVVLLINEGYHFLKLLP